MSKGRILVVDDDIDMSKMLRIYFDAQGYETLVADQSQNALNICRTKFPHIIILGVTSLDTDSYKVYHTLKSNTRVKHIPIIFLIQIGGQDSKISELKIDTDDVIISPFDIEELKRRVERKLHTNLTHPITNLPTGKLIEGQLKIAKHTPENRALLYCNLTIDKTASLSFGETLIFLADILNETVETYGSPNDFIGQPSDNNFLIITTSEVIPTIREVITERFNEQMGQAAALSCHEVKL